MNEHIKSWCADIEPGAIEQINNLTTHSRRVGHIAIMPDCHQGYGMPIGGVAALRDAISPNMVGVDIGCGVLTVETDIVDIPREKLKELMGAVRKHIPVGFNRHSEQQVHPIFNDKAWDETVICKREKDKARFQIGTLGGGNHFIEFQEDEDKKLWIMIHSGSRNLGKQVCDHYSAIAKKLSADWGYTQEVKNDLAFLPSGSEEGKLYIKEMSLCLDFARINRRTMLCKIEELLEEILDDSPLYSYSDIINVHHNYATRFNVDGVMCWLHRKGATSAKKGETGIIPGSMGTSSYIVEGLGNRDSHYSCSHGAGRLLSRTAAKNTLDVTTVAAKLDELGIVHGIRHKNDLEEAPEAYKDIDEVMEAQRDLVKVIKKLKPIGVIKG